MGHTKTTAVSFAAILKKAKEGSYKLPEFQRKWKWSSRQVMSLYESLRLGYPIGSFLFLSSEVGEKLHPRSFYGAGKKAANNPEHESLVLDGQQRITAGMSIYYGLDDAEGSEYYIDYRKIESLINEQRVNVDDEDSVKAFCANLDLEDSYLVAKQRRADRRSHFVKGDFIWTAFLTDEKSDDLDELVDDIADKKKKDIIRKVIRKHLRPSVNVQVPIIELLKEFDLASISKVFSTINSSGKLLTPFELVVAILYPSGIRLEDEIEEFRSKHRHYDHMDRNGEILLQTVALLSGRSPKKADLPKNIEALNYEKYSQEAARKLEEAGKFLTDRMGVGLDVTDKLTPYDAIFAPFAIALAQISERGLSVSELGKAQRKLQMWFAASAIGQRYQEGVHNKQKSDLDDVMKWVADDTQVPAWIRNTYVTPAIKTASPNGAIGRLLTCLINRRRPKDPVLNGEIGFGERLGSTQIHHIFPTRWVQKGLKDASTRKVEPNLALNIMLLDAATNGDWLNFDPRSQVEQSQNVLSAEITRDRFATQLIDQDALAVLLKSEKVVADYEDFLSHRYRALVRELGEFEIVESAADSSKELVELDEPSIEEH